LEEMLSQSCRVSFKLMTNKSKLLIKIKNAPMLVLLQRKFSISHKKWLNLKPKKKKREKRK